MNQKALALVLVVLLIVFASIPSVIGDEGGEEEESDDEENLGLHHWSAIVSLIFLVGAVITGVVLYFGKLSERYSEIMYLHLVLGVLTLLIFFLTSWVMI